MIDRYFVPLGDEYEIRKHIRGMLVFGEHDLARRSPFPRIDLILCRNVLIYFTLPLQRRALELFAFSLRNGGYLVLGKSETISPRGENFAPDQTSLKVFRRVGTRNQILHSHIREAMPPASSRMPALKESQGASRARSIRVPGKADDQALVGDEEGLLHELPCGVTVVDRDYDVRYINPEARRLFGVHTTAIGQDLIHLVQRHDPIAIRRIIDRVVQSGEPSSTILTSGDASADGPHRVEVTRRTIKQGDETRIVLTSTDVTEREQLREHVAVAENATARLIRANEEVLVANRQLTRTIQELRAENEQLQVTSVEIQAATEEVETLNEELQASNEELETLNEELQATIEELNTTNDDLEARSLELQAMAISAENARHQLRGILDAVGVGVLVVDEHQSIVLHSGSITNLLNGDGEITGVPRRVWKVHGRRRIPGCQGGARAELRHGAAGSVTVRGHEDVPNRGPANGDREWSAAWRDDDPPERGWTGAGRRTRARWEEPLEGLPARRPGSGRCAPNSPWALTRTFHRSARRSNELRQRYGVNQRDASHSLE